jgi:class 3 adenylate cyclase
VNTAARVESLTKEARVDVLVTAATAALLGEPAHLRELAAMSARGKRDVLQVFGLVDA